MRCDEADNDIAEFLRGTLPPHSPLPEHLAACARCRVRVEELRQVWADLDAIAVPATAPVMQGRLLATIAEAKLEPRTPRRTPMPLALKPLLLILFSMSSALFVGHRLVEPLPKPGPAVEAPAANANAPHFRGGGPEAGVKIVQYGDYECSPCFPYNAVVKEVLNRYGQDVRFEYRHFPLTRIHRHAVGAAIAAEAAGMQDRFWEMHDLLLSSRADWSRSENEEQDFARLAAAIGVDADRFVEAFRRPELRQRVMNDYASGEQLGVAATPTFIINGTKLAELPQKPEDFYALIDAEVRKRR